MHIFVELGWWVCRGEGRCRSGRSADGAGRRARSGTDLRVVPAVIEADRQTRRTAALSRRAEHANCHDEGSVRCHLPTSAAYCDEEIGRRR